MKHILNNKQMYQVEEQAMQTFHLPSLVLMERAALKVAQAIMGKALPGQRILVLCGIGNNGADGLAVSRLLAEQKLQVSTVLLGERKACTKENVQQQQMLAAYGVEILTEIPKEQTFDFYVDGLFGIGCNRLMEGIYREALDWVNKQPGWKVAIDIPSGIDERGQVLGVAFQADETLTFSFQKTGQSFYPGKEYCGTIKVEQIGITEQMLPSRCEGLLAMGTEDLKEKLPKRSGNSHKGTYGKLLVIAGSENMAGAAYLCTKAAYLCGVGLVQIYTPECNRSILQSMLPEAILSTYQDKWSEKQLLDGLQWADAVLIGPGLGTNTQMRKLLDFVYLNAATPVVCDADGLNLLSEHTNLLLQPHTDWILTPHLMEMSRLRKESVSYIKEHLVETATEFARDYQVMVALKDAVSVVAVPYEDTYINLSGNHGMATAGSGDVLAGVIAGLLTTGISSKDAVATGVFLHGLAGDDAARRKSSYSMMASDILEGITNVFRELEG